MIKDHLTIVFAALEIAHFLADTTGMSIKKIVRTLRPIQQISIQIACQSHLAEDPLTEPVKAILERLKVPPP